VSLDVGGHVITVDFLIGIGKNGACVDTVFSCCLAELPHEGRVLE
jgi:hypothetical protein